MLDFPNQINEDVIGENYGIPTPKTPQFFFRKLNGADGPFKNGLNN